MEIKISNSIKYIGASVYDLDLFESQYFFWKEFSHASLKLF